MILSSAEQRRALLARSRSIAVVGVSPKTARPSAGVFAFLRARGDLEVSPINPAVTAIDGVVAYPTLAAYAAAHGAPDIVNVFRKPAEAVHVARAAVAIGARAIWFQLGVAGDDAIRIADAAGLDVVADCCIKVELRLLDAALGRAPEPAAG